ncbi:MAG: hypothetical protein QF878_00645 [SAR202 cluster bacterium]|nr:hypothetical protein [SAR202 cluster bacterium]
MTNQPASPASADAILDAERGGVTGFFDRAEVRQTIVALIIALTVTYSVMYTSLQYFNSNNVAGNSDALTYMEFATATGDIESRRSKQARIFTIWLVKLVPNPPSWIFSRDRTVNDEWLLRIKFAAVNSALVVGTAMLVWLLLRRQEFSVMESYLGMLMFLGSLFIVYTTTIPMVEASNYFFIALGAYAIFSEKLPLYGLALLLGLFAKETAGIILPLALVTYPRRWFAWFAWAVPGLAIYMVFRAYSISTGEGDLGHFDPEHLKGAIQSFTGLFRFNQGAELVGAFGLLWIAAGYAALKGKLSSLYRRQLLIVALLLLIALGFVVSLGRTVYMAFPVVIPVALLGIRAFLDQDSESSIDSNQTTYA